MAPKTTTILHLPPFTIPPQSSSSSSSSSHIAVQPSPSPSPSPALSMSTSSVTSSLQSTPTSLVATTATAAIATIATVGRLNRSSTLQKKRRRVKALSVGNSPHERSASMSSTGSFDGDGLASPDHSKWGGGMAPTSNPGTGVSSSGSSGGKSSTYIARVALGLKALAVVGGDKEKTSSSSPNSNINNYGHGLELSGGNSKLDISSSNTSRGAGILFSASSSSGQSRSKTSTPVPQLMGSRPGTPANALLDIDKPLPSRPGSPGIFSGISTNSTLDASSGTRSNSRLTALAGLADCGYSSKVNSLLFCDQDITGTSYGSSGLGMRHKNDSTSSLTNPKSLGEEFATAKATRLEPIIPVHVLDQMVSSPQEMSPATSLVNPFYNRTCAELEKQMGGIRAAASRGRAAALEDNEQLDGPPQRATAVNSGSRSRSSSRGRVRMVEIRRKPSGAKVARSLSRSDSAKRPSRSRKDEEGLPPRAGTSMGLMRPSTSGSNRRSAIEDGFLDVMGLQEEISVANPFAEENEGEEEKERGREEETGPNADLGEDLRSRKIEKEKESPAMVDITGITSIDNERKGRGEKRRADTPSPETSGTSSPARSRSGSRSRTRIASSRSRSRPTTPESFYGGRSGSPDISKNNLLADLDPALVLRKRLQLMGGKKPRTPSPLRHAASDINLGESLRLSSRGQLVNVDIIPSPKLDQRPRLEGHSSSGSLFTRFLSDAGSAEGSQANSPVQAHPTAATTRAVKRKPVPNMSKNPSLTLELKKPVNFPIPPPPPPKANVEVVDAEQLIAALSMDMSEDEEDGLKTPATGSFVTPLLPTPFPPKRPEMTPRSHSTPDRMYQAQMDRFFHSVALNYPPTPPKTSSSPPPSEITNNIGSSAGRSTNRTMISTTSSSSSLVSLSSSQTSTTRPPLQPSETIPPLSPPLTDVSDRSDHVHRRISSEPDPHAHLREQTLHEKHLAVRLDLAHERALWEKERRTLHSSINRLQSENERLRDLVEQLTERMERNDAVFIQVQQMQQQQQQHHLRKAWGLFMNPRTPPAIPVSGLATDRDPGHFGGPLASPAGKASRIGRKKSPPRVRVGSPDRGEEQERGRIAGIAPRMTRGRFVSKVVPSSQVANGQRSRSPPEGRSGASPRGLWKRSAGRGSKKPVLLVVDG